MMLTYPYQNFYEIMEANAKNDPKKTAIFMDDHKVSYVKLKHHIDTFARFLEFSSIKSGDRVAMIVGNSVEFIVSLFAITKIGAIAVPLNTFLKKEEFEYILNDCSAKMLVCSASFANETKNLLDTTKIEKIIWCDDYPHLDERNYSFSEIDASADRHGYVTKKPKLDDLACIVYTSGTTGKPKGAMLSYRNIFSNAISGADSFHITCKDRFIVFLPMFHSFTLSIMVLLPLFTCSSIVIVRSVFPFANVLKQTLLKRVTIFLGVPTLYNALLKAKIPWYFMWFNQVRIFISGSAPLSEQSLNDFNAKFKKATLLEGYGLSECSPAVCVNRLDHQKPLSVGLPLPSYEVKIVNEERVEVKTGEVGEIMVKGDCVMQGYLNHADATDETIINGWLLTGDLGKKDSDGFIYIVDRKKDLIISKGINIYPREIEEIIYKYEGIDAVAVIGIRDEQTKDEEVLAFIQLKEGVEIQESELRAYLKQHVANFKLPKHIYFVEELPKNATGKVLKRVLKENVKNGGILRKR
ncbi:long-chain-fatty-acid--CoA ligase [Sulfurospirillum halorespirans DSM 13726]|uniref:Long-chain-fatty-acid--CoA ligase n=2 Tax=Sulfurospirillum halorespirans TaxID=194424 RepID=A0A1D7TG63_9BACT|nr:long-chain-fatty-acid--CoA ligase [Sulfurospirillum halorespirans DSM 13726]